MSSSRYGLHEPASRSTGFGAAMLLEHRRVRRGIGGPEEAERCPALAIGFDLSAIASIGSAIALLVFALVSAGHLRVRHETGARTSLLVVAVGSAALVLVAFSLTTLVTEPATAIAIVVIVMVSVALDFVWKRSRGARR
jgi:hypothetical protein